MAFEAMPAAHGRRAYFKQLLLMPPVFPERQCGWGKGLGKAVSLTLSVSNLKYIEVWKYICLQHHVLQLNVVQKKCCLCFSNLTHFGCIDLA